MKKIALSLLLLMAGLPLHAKEFLNTILHINFGATYGLVYGEIFNEEHDAYYITQQNNKLRAKHYDSSFSLFIDLAPLPPIILGNESHAVKFGIRSGIRMQYINQSITINSSNMEKTYGGDLMISNSWMAGPVIHYAPMIQASGLGDTFTAGGGFTFFVLYGRPMSAELTAYPARRSHDGESSVSGYRSEMGGYRIDAGMGGEISICSLNLGINLFYSYLNIDLKKNIYPNVGKSTTITEFCMEIYIGIPIQWDEFPKIF